MNAYSAEQKPLISLYVLGENKNNKSIKISIQSTLNQSGFVIKDGNRSIKNLDFKNSKYATGRRKKSIAKVWLKKGSGKIIVNGKDLSLIHI